MRLVLVRHAQSTGNHEGRWQGHADYPLSALGHEQARRVAASFQSDVDDDGHETTLLYASPLERAAHTAQAISDVLDVPVTPWALLKEYDVGVFSGLTREEIRTQHPDIATTFYQDRNWNTVPQAETVESRAHRAEAVLDHLIAHHPGNERVICVTHGGFMQYLVAAVLRTERIWGFRPGNTSVFEFDLTAGAHRESRNTPAGLSPYTCRIERFNDMAHLFDQN